MIKTLFFKLAGLAFLVCCSQAMVYLAQVRLGLGYPSRIEPIYRILASKPDVLYFGDSTLTVVSSGDTVKLTMPEILQGLLPGKRVETINSGAYHSGVYYSLGKRLAQKGGRNTILVVPINPRSFPAAWDMRPEYQFTREILLLDHDSFLLRVFYKPLSVFKVFDAVPVTEEAFDRLPVYEGARVIGRMREFRGEAGKGATTEERMRNRIRYLYMESITGRHRKVAAFQALARLLKRERMNAVFYVTPVDYQRCEKYLGPEFLAQMRRNVAVARGAIEAEGYPVLDLSEALPSESFLGTEEISFSEHLKYKGRAFVSRRLAEKIARLRP